MKEMSPTANAQLRSVTKYKEQIVQNAKHIGMLETIILRHEASIMDLKNDIVQLQRKQKNTYGVM